MKTDTISGVVAMPKRSWWRRWRQPVRPAGTLHIRMQFKPSGDPVWQVGEATVEYPEGIETVKLDMITLIDGQAIDLIHWPEVTATENDDEAAD